MNILVKAAIRLSMAAAALSSVSACATVVRGTNDHYRVESTPPNAVVTTSHGFTCRTPCTMELPRKSTFEIKVAMDGYKDFDMHVSNAISGEGAAGLAGNVIVGGVIGIGVDAISGASLDLKPNPLIVTLEPNGSAEPSHISGAPAAAPAGGN